MCGMTHKKEPPGRGGPRSRIALTRKTRRPWRIQMAPQEAAQPSDGAQGQTRHATLRKYRRARSFYWEACGRQGGSPQEDWFRAVEVRPPPADLEPLNPKQQGRLKSRDFRQFGGHRAWVRPLLVLGGTQARPELTTTQR